MRKLLMAAGFAAAAFIPSLASAQQSCAPPRDTSNAGIAASVINALLGNAATSTQCAQVYGYYDANGMWHANAVNGANAQGYYDSHGTWVAGAPNGYYDSQGRWVAANTNASASGYYDSQRRWVPASAQGYYDQNGRWVAGAASGYYQNGRWIAGPAVGHYDQNGRWISGQPSGHQGANGVWVADAQPGYYDTDGRWRAGAVHGYYDTQGRWITTSQSNNSQMGQGYGNNSHGYRDMWAGAPNGVMGRLTWLEQRIRAGINDRTLNSAEGTRALRSLSVIRQDERRMSHRQGQLSQRGRSLIQARLDTVNRGLHWARHDWRR